MKKLIVYTPYGIVFFSSMSVMIVELVASRIISKYFGNSLYTWTGIIGVVLGGISLGNFIGGKLADKFDPTRIMRPLLILSGLLVTLILILDALIQYSMTAGDPRITWAFVLRAVSIIVLLFFLPSTALGTISPVMARYALLESSKVGSTVGGIYAVSSIGSIVGTFLSGFFLIPAFGIRTILVVVSSVLLLLALLTPGKRLGVSDAVKIVAVFIAVLLVSYVTGRSAPDGGYVVRMEKDTRYSHIAVKDTVRDGTVVERVLIMDGLIHNMYDPRDPDKLLYEYERIYKAMTEYQSERKSGEDSSGLRTLTIGGGALTFPSYLERHFSPLDNTVVEIDPEVIETAYAWFDIPASSGMNVVPADGRNYVQWAASNGNVYDIVYLDAFSSFSVPYHLTTKEFLEKVSDVTAENGLVLINLIDIFSEGRFLNAFLNSAGSVFPETAVYRTPGMSLESRATFILAATRTGRLPETLLNSDGFQEADRLTETQLAELSARNGDMMLTDSYAPVENLIAPVFLKSIN